MYKPWLDNYPPGVSAEINESTLINLVDMVEDTFERHPEHTAYINMGHKLTFAELEVKSRHIASYLQHATTLNKGDRVAVMIPNLLQYPIILLGILRAGLIVVNVNPLYTPFELKHQLNDSGAKAIFIAENFAHTLQSIIQETNIKHLVLTKIGDGLPFIKRRLVNFTVAHVKRMVPRFKLANTCDYHRALKIGAKGQYTRPMISINDIAFIQYTGGTTGVPKGVAMTHRNMASSLAQVEETFGSCLTQGKELLVTALPMYHAFALNINCFFFLKRGDSNLLIENPRDIDSFIDILSQYQFTSITGVNTLFNALLNHSKIGKVDFSLLKFTIAGGMPTQHKVAEDWKNITGNTIIEGYGLTETTAIVSVNAYNLAKHTGAVGLPMPNTDVRLIDQNNFVVEDLNCVGEIQVKGPQVMTEYWNNPTETEAAFDQGWFKTGDIGLFDNDGLLRIVDRKKDMILVSGFNVYPNEIEDTVLKLAGVYEAAVIGEKDKDGNEAVILFVVINDLQVSIDKIKAHCRDYLTGYKQPKKIKIVNELPKNNVGKVLRRLLKEKP
ncbi:AMP-binding protein [Psychromonas sp. 14N.309.X.WAT.B.A12]|uniref:AMP-binding protein n=1 Tax=Psychromonas sp. 14N.309.X.WAT.B.A12 TaxID=2998322 RepID=UPI0025AEE3BB|nr:AMP-binding protein [Psychromonas sp. 14N.309.X.WAT.B.A12]MDN2663186.1 AMP-binding protein [Psychromonas sp. 14N.309.X.WAT.B.A12]